MDIELSDSELLTHFARGRDQQAFAALVERHAGLVYSAAFRQVGPALAEDVSQTVFFVLAQKAHRVDGRTLAGWLVVAARMAALAVQRSEARRTHREQRAATMQRESAGNRPHEDVMQWEQLAPLLDEALARLGERDRNAVTMRYLQGKTVREVATTMQLTEAAAGKRATRAIQSLREYFARRGFNLTTDALGSVLAANGVAAIPIGLAGKLAASGIAAVSGAAAATTLTATAAGFVNGGLPIMVGTKSYAAVAVVVGLFVIGGAVLLATQLSSFGSRGTPASPSPVNVQTIKAAAGVAPPPATQPAAVDSAVEILTRFPTPAGQPAAFSGRVEGLLDPLSAEVGIVSLRGVHWTTNTNYQWQPVGADGSFTIAADKHPSERRALAVRSPEQATTFLRAEFNPNESARDIVLRMEPTRVIQIAAHDSSGNTIPSFKVEIFDSGVAGGPGRTDDAGQRLRSQRLGAPTSVGGLVTAAVPLEPISVLISGNGIAPYFHTIDPRASDHFDFKLLAATPIGGVVTENGVPVGGLSLMLNNDAVPLSYTARKTDAEGKFLVPAGIPGTYNIRVRNKTLRVPLIEGEPATVNIELTTLNEPATRPAQSTQPSAAIDAAN